MGDEVDAQLIQGGEDGLDDKTLRRWLVARKWKLEDAIKSLRAHALWRVGVAPKGRIQNSEVMSGIEENKNYLQGFTHAGQPVAIMVVKNHRKQEVEAVRKYITYCIDAHVALGKLNPNDSGKSSGILDLRGMGLKNACFNSLKSLFDLLQSHFVERLGTMWIYDAPYIFLGLFNLVSPFIDPVTRKKVQFVYPGQESEKQMFSAIPKEILPEDMGGTGTLIRIDEAWERIDKQDLSLWLAKGQKLP